MILSAATWLPTVALTPIASPAYVVGGVMVAFKAPLAFVVPCFALSVPSVEESVIARPEAGPPLLLDAATTICHGPFPGPPSTGVARRTREASGGGGEVIVIGAVPDFVGSWVEVALTVAPPDTGTAAGAV